MRGSKRGCAEHTPFRIEPQLIEVTEDGGQPSTDELRGVFDEDPSRLAFIDDAPHFPPESTLGTAETGSLTGGGHISAGKSTRDNIDP
jgi:hypothetical protein